MSKVEEIYLAQLGVRQFLKVDQAVMVSRT